MFGIYIGIDTDLGSWVLQVLDTDPPRIYPFLSGDGFTEVENMQRLAEAMSNGVDSLGQIVYECLDVSKENFPSVNNFINSVWGSSDSITYIGVDNTFEAAEGESLLDDLETAGEWLAGLVG